MPPEARISLRPGLLRAQSGLALRRLQNRASQENFPVAMRWLPAALREDLLTVYATARLIDETGDAAAGDRRRLLDELEAEIEAAFRGEAHQPVLRALTRTIERRRLTKAPFLRLIEANRFDQQEPDLERWDDLLDYCSLSANPVGELVLQLFDCATPERIALSNDVCSALQIVEHCQDVAEDARVQRVYLPRVDRIEFGCRNQDLIQEPASPALRRVIAVQVERARRLLAAGAPLVGGLRGNARLAVSGYVAGAMATCEALERADFDPNSQAVRPRRRDLLRHFLSLYGFGGGSPARTS